MWTAHLGSISTFSRSLLCATQWQPNNTTPHSAKSGIKWPTWLFVTGHCTLGFTCVWSTKQSEKGCCRKSEVMHLTRCWSKSYMMSWSVRWAILQRISANVLSARLSWTSWNSNSSHVNKIQVVDSRRTSGSLPVLINWVENWRSRRWCVSSSSRRTSRTHRH